MSTEYKEMVGDILIHLGEAIKQEQPTNDEINLVFDSIKESPEQFEELYKDFIEDAMVAKMAYVSRLLRRLVAGINIENSSKLDAIINYEQGRKSGD